MEMEEIQSGLAHGNEQSKVLDRSSKPERLNDVKYDAWLGKHNEFFISRVSITASN